MRILFFGTLIFFLIPGAYSQGPAESNESADIFKIIGEPSSHQGNVTIKQDDQVKALVSRYIEARRKENSIPGYKIRIFSNSGQSARNKAYSERDRFVRSFPDMPSPSVDFETPNFKVYVGGFRTKNDAFKAYKQIRKEFKNAFLVPARISLPKI
jgi:hypothetical protein